jgi:hypothetical protein
MISSHYVLLAVLATLRVSLTIAVPGYTPPSYQLQGGCSVSTPPGGRKTCTVHPLDNESDDTLSIFKAFAVCGNGGTVVFPECENPVVQELL